MKIQHQHSGVDPMQEEVSLELEPETVGKPIQPASTITRERLETAVTKIEDLANQDNDDLHWKLRELAKKTRGRLIDPGTAKITWMYEDPFDNPPDIRYLVRAPENEVWIAIDDLPAQTSEALMTKISAGEIEDDQPERERWPLWARYQLEK
jgi:hypothetical protein